MKSARSVPAILTFVLCCVTAAPLAAQEGEWKKSSEEDGIVGYTRPTPKSIIDEVMAVGVIDAPIQAVEAVIRDPKAQTDVMYRCEESRIVETPEMKRTTDIYYLYNVTGMPFPVKSRDVVARLQLTIDPETGIIYTHSENVETDYGRTGKNVRMPYATLSYKLVPKGPDRTEVTYLCLADPGGSLPAFLVNMLGRDLGVKTLAGIREVVQRDEYMNTPAVLTTTPVESHPLKND
jgi:hypothetical protein